MRLNSLIFITTLLVFSSANACFLSKDLIGNTDPTMNCEYYVKEFAERVSECIHWRGEDAYDSKRGNQIRKAVEKLRCDKVESDGKKLLQTNHGQTENQEVIKSVLQFWVNN